jgi:2'-5' RNA ligase
MRAFLALPVPDIPANALMAAQAGLPQGRPVPRENLHLTLAFLGEAGDDLLEEIDATLSTRPPHAAEVRVTGVGIMEHGERGLVVAHVAQEASLVALHQAVVTNARRAGAELARRRFRPHVTLARGVRPEPGTPSDRLAAWLGANARTGVPPWRAEAVCLYESHLGPDGPDYEEISRYPLR